MIINIIIIIKTTSSSTTTTIKIGSCVLECSSHGDAIHGLCWLDQHVFATGCENGSLLGHDIRVRPDTGTGSVFNYSLAGLIGGPG